MSETSNITGPLIKALQKAKVMVFRMPVGRLQKGRHWIHLCAEGTADILCFPASNTVLWIETKDPTGYTHKHRVETQALFAAEVRALGHYYVIVKSVDEGLAAVDALSTLHQKGS